MILFRTTESDDQTITIENNVFYCKRYGLPKYQITEEQAKNIAWFELNRRGRFAHFRKFTEGSNCPTLENKPAQDYMVKIALKSGIN